MQKALDCADPGMLRLDTVPQDIFEVENRQSCDWSVSPTLLVCFISTGSLFPGGHYFHRGSVRMSNAAVVHTYRNCC